LDELNEIFVCEKDFAAESFDHLLLGDILPVTSSPAFLVVGTLNKGQV